LDHYIQFCPIHLLFSKKLILAYDDRCPEQSG